MNKELISELSVLLDEAKLGSDPNDKFRVKSYKTAIDKILALDKKIEKPTDIPLTKGGKIYQKIVEFLEKGHIGKTQEILHENEAVIDIYREIQSVAEIGPVKAKELVEVFHIRSIDELKNRAEECLNDKQKIGLKYYETDKLRIPREEIQKHERFYKAILKNLDCGLKFSINGSYRRGAKDSGDIDILVSHPKGNQKSFRLFVDSLIENEYLIDHLAYGEKKYMGYGRLFLEGSIPRRIDIIYTLPNEYPFAQLYFTGCGSFNVRMREFASRKGFRLNEKSLIDITTEKPAKGTEKIKTEKDIFHYLNLEYVEPENRVESYIFS